MICQQNDCQYSGSACLSPLVLYFPSLFCLLAGLIFVFLFSFRVFQFFRTLMAVVLLISILFAVVFSIAAPMIAIICCCCCCGYTEKNYVDL